MGRRESHVTIRCAVAGCDDFALYAYRTNKEYAELDRKRGAYKCSRHAKPEEVLTQDNPVISHVLTASAGKRVKGLYWNSGSGFTFGPGFKAFADDFPEGTKIEITYRLVLP